MSGAGKTTAARRISDALDVPFHEMDALAIGPGWSTPVTFVDDVAALLAQARWVFDSWGRVEVRDAMWAAADTVVWLDYPRRVVLPRLLRRSVRRPARGGGVLGGVGRGAGGPPATGQRLFGGNVETWRGWLAPGHPFWHAVTTFGQRRAYLAARTGTEPGIAVVRLRTPRDLDRWLADLEPSP